MSLLVICPLKKELTDFLFAVKALGHDSQQVKFPDRAVYEIPSLNIFATTGGLGKVRMALSTQKLLTHFPKIKSVVCMGVAGSLGAPVRALDVVVASHTVEHDFITRFEGEDTTRPQYSSCISQTVVNELKQTLDGNYSIHYSPIASGDEDIVCQNRAAELRELTQAVAVAWEGAGAGRACVENSRNFCEIRGISDSANGSSSMDFAKNLPKAMTNATEVLLHLHPAFD